MKRVIVILLLAASAISAPLEAAKKPKEPAVWTSIKVDSVELLPTDSLYPGTVGVRLVFHTANGYVVEGYIDIHSSTRESVAATIQVGETLEALTSFWIPSDNVQVPLRRPGQKRPWRFLVKSARQDASTPAAS